MHFLGHKLICISENLHLKKAGASAPTLYSRAKLSMEIARQEERCSPRGSVAPRPDSVSGC